MDVRAIAHGLWRWTAPHPAWEPDAEPESPADWPEEVGSVLVESQDGVAVFVDPQLPHDPAAFWTWADGIVAGRPVLVVTTISWHGRSRDAVLARYEPAQSVPADIELLAFPRLGESIVWLPAQRVLVPGDRIVGAAGGRIRLCPASWLRYLPEKPTVDDMRDDLRPLLDLPVERVLVSHGEPVLERGHEALAQALCGVEAADSIRKPYRIGHVRRSISKEMTTATPIATRRTGTAVAVVVLRGELDAYNAPAVRQELLGALDGGNGVVLDLRAATFLDSVVGGEILEAWKEAKRREVAFGLVVSDSRANHVRRMLEQMNLIEIFDVYDTPEEAAAAFSRS